MPSFADHFSSLSTAYFTSRPDYPEALFDFLCTQSPARGLTLDLGAGSGQATRQLAARRPHVIAIDASIRQLAAATSPEYVRLVSLAEQLPIPDGAAGLVVVAQAVHWFRHGGFLAEARRVLCDVGVLALVGYGTTTSSDPLVAEALKDISTMMDPWWPPERSILERGYEALDFPFVRLPTPAIPMERSWRRDDVLSYIATWSALSRAGDAREGLLDRVGARLRRAWPDGDARTISWPFYLLAGRR